MLLVQERTLAKLLCLSQKRMAYLAGIEGFRTKKIKKVKYYFTEEVDIYLAKNSKNFRAPPTVEILLQGELVLVKTPAAAKLIGKARNTTAEIAQSEFSTIRVGVFTLISQQSVYAWLANQGVSRRQVRHILGVSENTVRLLVAKDELTSFSLANGQQPIAYWSLLYFVATLLPRSDCAEDWIEDRLASKLPLRSMSAFQLNGQKDDLSKIRYINHATCGEQIRLAMPESVLAYLKARETGYTSSILMTLWGLGTKGVYSYRHKYPDGFACPLHDHSQDKTYYKSCLLAILSRGGLGSNAKRWYEAVLVKGDAIVRSTYVLKTLGLNWPAYLKLRKTGKLLYTLTPGGDVVVLKSSVDKLKLEKE